LSIDNLVALRRFIEPYYPECPSVWGEVEALTLDEEARRVAEHPYTSGPPNHSSSQPDLARHMLLLFLLQ
jgi:hypothetical protein